MASAIIHMAVAKKVNEVLNIKPENHLLLGSIAPDIAKMVGSKRYISHFINESDKDITNVPNIDNFLNKYKEYLVHPYELGYYIHLLTDVLWFKEYLPNIADDQELIIYKDGVPIKYDEDEYMRILYNDYTKMNVEVVDYYGMDFSLFYEKFDYPVNHIEEVDEKYFDDVIKKFGDLSSGEANASYVMDIKRIVHFIEYATVYCLDEIDKLKNSSFK